MERLHGPINPCIFGQKHVDVESLEQESINAFGLCSFADTKSLSFEQGEELCIGNSSLDDKIPFLEMLQSAESPVFSPFTEPNSTSFQLLLRLQHPKKPWVQIRNCFPEMDTSTRSSRIIQPESCLTHDVFETHSSVKSDTKDRHENPHSTCCVDRVSSECNQEARPNSVNNNRERRKRKRARPPKNKEDVESQRMTHIAVERNRRRQMNDHLDALRSLMPSAYVQRSDQASIIGGAINFVKELEQLLQTLEAQNRNRNNPAVADGGGDTTTATSPPFNGMSESSLMQCTEDGEWNSQLRAENRSAVADVEATVIQNHVNLKVQCKRKAGQLLTTIVALEDLRLTVLHLNIASLETSVHYSFSLKMEEECMLKSADEIAGAVHQIFNFINSSR